MQPPHDRRDESRLLARARTGDSRAVEQLFETHAESASRLATLLAGPGRADDLVAEANRRVLEQLHAGRGPVEDFRAYLHMTIRNLYRDALRRAQEQPSSHLPWLLDQVEPSVDQLFAEVDDDQAMTAWSALPQPWQQVLWHVEVEGRKPADVASLLSTSSANISSLLYRAREALRTSYLDLRIEGMPQGEACSWARPRLSRYVRGTLSSRGSRKVADHVADCVMCTAAVETLESTNDRFAVLVLPVALAAATGTVAASSLSTGQGRTPRGQRAWRSTTGPGSAARLASLVAVGVLVAGGLSWAFGAAQGPSHDATERIGPGGPGPQLPIEPRIPFGPAAVLTPPRDLRSAVPLRPVAPTTVRIAACGVYGSLTMASTPGITYALIRGDGREGPWRVTATAQPGYVIAEGAARSFAGDLGQHTACPAIDDVTKSPTGDPTSNPWDVTVSLNTAGVAPGPLQVVYSFDTGVLISGQSGTGWICREPTGTAVGAGTDYYFPDAGTPFTCTFDYTGSPPPPVTLTVLASDPVTQSVEPHGDVTLSRDGRVYDERSIG